MDEILNNQSVVETPQKGNLMNKVSFWLLLVSTVLLPIFFVPVSFISIQFGTSLLFSFSVILATILYIVTGITTGSLDLPKSSKYTLGLLSVVPIVYMLAVMSVLSFSLF